MFAEILVCCFGIKYTKFIKKIFDMKYNKFNTIYKEIDII